MHGFGPEVVQRDNPLDHGCQRRRNPRIAHVGEMHLALHVQLVDRSVEGLFDLAGRTREIDQDPVGVDLVDAEAVRLEPSGNLIDILLRHAELLAEFVGSQPLVEIGRVLVVQRVDQLVELFFLLGRALQQEEHVLGIEVVRNRAAVILKVRLGPRVAGQPHRLGLVDLLRDPSAARQGCMNQVLNGRGDRSDDLLRVRDQHGCLGVRNIEAKGCNER